MRNVRLQDLTLITVIVIVGLKNYGILICVHDNQGDGAEGGAL
jgi:hypothetical protein